MCVLHAAAAAPELEITVISKGAVGRSGCTRMVQGGFNAVLDPADSFDLHFGDTVKATALAKVADFSEYRIRQTGINTVVVEIGGRESLSSDETDALIKLIKVHAGDEFDIQVKTVTHIDWGSNTKRLGFHNELL